MFGHSPTESEGDFFSGDSDGKPSSYPYPVSKIPSPSQPSPPKKSQEGDISREGDQVEPRRKYQQNKWHGAVCEQGSDDKLKIVELNKLNGQLYTLTFGP